MPNVDYPGTTRYADQATLAHIKRLEDALHAILLLDAANPQAYIQQADAIACEAMKEVGMYNNNYKQR